MRRTHLAVQAAIVLTMVALVSWPQFRPLHAQTVWRFSPNAVAQAQADDARRFSSESPETARQPFRLGNAAYTDTTTATRTTTLGGRSDIERAGTSGIPASITKLGGLSNALLGRALNSLNVPVAYARIVLRNLKTGRVIGRTMADSQGQFRFLDLDAELYVVEMLGADGSVVATSSAMSLGRGDLRQAELRVPVTATTVAAVVGSYTGALQQATNVAAGNGVTRTTTTLQSQESSR